MVTMRRQNLIEAKLVLSIALLVYNLLLILAAPLILLNYGFKLWRRPDYRQRWTERLGAFPTARQTGGLHIHAVSLGEAKVGAKVVNALRQQQPELPVVFTCSTATASEFIRNTFADRVDHCYLPLDFPWVVQRFQRRFQPQLCVIVEVEWWPNLIHQYAKRDIPVVMVNAKMTASSARTYQRFGSLFAQMCQGVTQVLAQNPSSFAEFKQLGLTDTQLTLTNNIKFDEAPQTHFTASIEQLRALLVHRPVWVAGSTHEEDEEQVLEAFQQLLTSHPELLLILVPRHPERFVQVATKCSQLGLNIARRSLNQAPAAETQILLGDTLGELAELYSLGQFAFIGGSITARGGHNPLEAAIYGIPLLIGPSQFNSAEIVGPLEDAGALKVVHNAHDIQQQLLLWLQDPEARATAGAQSAKVIADNGGALAKTSQYLLGIINSRH